MNSHPPLPNNEIARLNALYQYQILDTGREKVFDDFTFLAAQICRTPIALISLLDGNRQWFKSKVGLTASETSRDVAFCAHTILQRKPLVVRNALRDSRFATNPLVLSDPNIRFYAGAPLVTPDGFGVGTLCVIDVVPRDLSGEQVEGLRLLSDQVIAQFELRRNAIALSRTITQRQEAAAQLRRQYDFIEVYYRQGEEKARQGDYHGAIADFNDFLRFHPKGFKAYYSRGLARQKVGDYEGAILDFDMYLKFNPNDAEARNNRGLLRFEMGDYKGAIADYSNAMHLKADYPISGEMGLISSAIDVQEVIVNHTHSLGFDPNHVDTDIHISQTPTRSELENDSDVLEDNSQFLLDPEGIDVDLSLGYAHSESEDLAHLEVSVDQSRYPLEQTTQSGRITIENGKPSMNGENGRYELENDNGTQNHNQSLTIHPQDAPAYMSRGNARFTHKDYTGAIEDYTQFLRLYPQDTEAYICRGNARFELEDYAGAIEDYTRSIGLGSTNAEAYINRAHARSKLKDYGGAIEDYSQFLRFNPNDAKAYISRGNARSKLKDYSGAIEDYKRVWSKAIEQLPKLPSEDS
jgi:tetratricopeptide (TPR) repeat protein